MRNLNDLEKSLSGKTVLVTGAAGFIGSHLTERLLAAGCRVRALVRYNSKGSSGFLKDAPGLEILYGDVMDAPFCLHAMQGCQMVFHLAALIGIPYSYVAPDSYVNVNIQGTLNLLQASRTLGLERFVQTSTSEVYGSAQSLPMSELHPLHPQSPYAATKVGADQLAHTFYLCFGLPVTIVRPFNTYGPRQSLRAVLPAICAQALKGSRLQLGNLEARRDLTHVEDTCAGFLHAAASERANGAIVNLGYGEAYSIQELVDRVGALLQKKLTVEVEPQRLRPASSEVDHLLSDNRLAAELMAWEPVINLDSGLASLLDWLRLESHQKLEYAV